MKEQRNITKKMLKKKKITSMASNVFAALVVAAVYGILPVYGATDMAQVIIGAMEKVYIAMLAVTPAIVIVVYVAAKIWQIVVPEKEGRREPRDWARSAFVNYVKILLAGTIITFIAEIATGFPTMNF